MPIRFVLYTSKETRRPRKASLSALHKSEGGLKEQDLDCREDAQIRLISASFTYFDQWNRINARCSSYIRLG